MMSSATPSMAQRTRSPKRSHRPRWCLHFARCWRRSPQDDCEASARPATTSVAAASHPQPRAWKAAGHEQSQGRRERQNDFRQQVQVDRFIRQAKYLPVDVPSPPLPPTNALAAVPIPRLPAARPARAPGRMRLRKNSGCKPIQSTNTPNGTSAMAPANVMSPRPVTLVHVLAAVTVTALAQRAEEHALHQPQHVPGPQHHAEDGQHGDHLVLPAPAPRAASAKPAGTCRAAAGTRRQSRSAPAGRCWRA